MSEHDLAEVRDVFGAALELPGDRRAAFLDERCADAPGLRAEVEALLDRHASLGAFLETPLAGPAILDAALAGGAATAAAGSPDLPPGSSLLAAGDRLGGFEVEAFLARGGSSEVYTARQLRLGGRRVALKVLAARTLSAATRRRFAREAQTASTIHHPHLVAVFDYGEDRERGLFYYAMRLVEGPTLQDVLAELAEAAAPPSGTMRRSLVLRFAEVAGALAALHARGLVHQDVKPANVVLEEAGKERLAQPAVLVDFGLVRPITPDRGQSTVWLTPTYAAPEVLMRRTADVRADVFSLGLLMHDLLAARLPEQRQQQAGEALERLGKLVPGIDPDLEAVVAKAASPERRWRYADAAALARDLRAWVAGAPVSARRIRGAAAARRWVQRNPGRVLGWALRGLAAGLLLVLLSAGIQRTAEVVAAVGSVRSAWNRGDLAAVPRPLGRVPRFLRPLLLPAQLAGLAAGRDDPAGRDPLAGVFRVLLRDGEPAARLHAARFLERDGFRARPVLKRFMVCSLDAPAAGAVRLAARLFFERPDRSPRQVAGSEPFRSRLLRVLELPADPATAFYALTALSGCGTHDSIPAIQSWMEDRVRSAGPDGSEAARLALHSIAAIVRRSRACGFADGLLELDRGRIIRRASAALATLARKIPGAEYAASPALVDLCRAIAFAERSAAALPVTTDPVLVRGRRSPRILAARRDPALGDALEHGRGIHAAAPTSESQPLFDRFGDYEEYGYLAGSWGSAALVSRLEARARKLAAEHGLDVDWCLKQYRAGVAMARDEEQGIRRAQRPDPDTRLDAFFAPDTAGPLRPEIHRDRTGTETAVAAWDFVRTPIRVAGSASRPTLVRVPMQADEWVPGARFARLGIGGASELRLPFAVAPRPDGVLAIEVELQKAVRNALPYGGVARIDILLDGSPVTEDLMILGAVTGTMTVPLCRARAHRRHVVTVRLSASSNTTLRIYSVRIGPQ